jgi:hypothetical protein
VFNSKSSNKNKISKNHPCTVDGSRVDAKTPLFSQTGEFLLFILSLSNAANPDLSQFAKVNPKVWIYWQIGILNKSKLNTLINTHIIV